MTTSLYKGQIPLRTKGQPTCIHHRGRQLDLYCKQCRELVCVKCLSTIHDTHPVCGLSDITPQNKKDIQNFIEKTEKDDIVQINQFITSTDQHLKDNTRTFEKITHQLKRQTSKLKQDLDLLTDRTLSFYKQIEDDNAKLLQTYKQDLDMYNTQLKQKVQECKIALQRGSDIQIYDAGCCDVHSPVNLPVKPALVTASFRPNRNFQSHMEQALGEVYTSGQGQGQASLGHDRSVASSAGQGQHSTQQRSEPEVRTPSTQQQSKGRKEMSSPVYTLLPQTSVLREWGSPCSITSVCPTTDGQVWTSDYYSYTLTLLDRNGELKHEVEHSTKIRDIRLSPTTNTLWACDYDNNNITELVSGRLVHRFSTKEIPQCICITASNHVIVGIKKHVSKFNTKGELVLTTSTAGTGKPLVYSPYRISECPVTHNVAVADWDDEEDGGEGKQHVVVMDTNFKELFVYDGEIPNRYQPTSQSGGKPFNPHGVVYDSVGNLVIGDSDNKRVLLISGCGEFLRLIHTDYHWTGAVGVDRENVLWVVFSYGNVKLLQYSSV